MAAALLYPDLIKKLIVLDVAPVEYKDTVIKDVNNKERGQFEVFIEAMERISEMRLADRSVISDELRKLGVNVNEGLSYTSVPTISRILLCVSFC